ncbi:TPA: hypothetical protein QDC03_007085 [Burkholderia cepacia]|uniref:hypothetical protein n=1 Tax=Burkholderia cepacia TaxID=292 RepID=UPI0011B2396B|nr:hypothetical protein [Burkholderia cepacia]HDR9511849.1 hypothetical protein [Burkholderia cepacia]
MPITGDANDEIPPITDEANDEAPPITSDENEETMDVKLLKPWPNVCATCISGAVNRLRRFVTFPITSPKLSCVPRPCATEPPRFVEGELEVFDSCDWGALRWSAESVLVDEFVS